MHAIPDPEIPPKAALPDLKLTLKGKGIEKAKVGKPRKIVDLSWVSMIT